MEIVLSIAGSDTSAGAGIQQDLKTMTAIGCYGATVITALTAQNTLGVQQVLPVPPQMVQQQLQSVLSDLQVRAIKIGQVPDAGVAQAIAHTLAQYPELPVVYDPVMVSTSGRKLMTDNTLDTVCQDLFPRCTLITPNLPEAEQLTGQRLDNEAAILTAGHALVEQYGTCFLIKGGHGEGTEMSDRLFQTDGSVQVYQTPRIHTANLHGTGCTLSSAIASYLALGHPLPQAIEHAKAFVTQAIELGKDLHIGSGNGPLWCF